MLEDICDTMEQELNNRDASKEARGKFKELKRGMIKEVGDKLMIMTH